MASILEAIKPILKIADKESDTDEEKRQHGFLIYMGILMSCGGVMWSSICISQDLYLPAYVPIAYITITIINFTILNYTKNFAIAQKVQIFISLLLPFFFQFFLGGYVASGGNVLWSVLAVFGSFTLRNRLGSTFWLILFILLMIFSGIVDPYAKEYDIGLSEGYIIFFFVLNFVVVVAIIFSLYYYFVSSEESARKKLAHSLEQLQMAQNQLLESEKMASLGSLVSGVAHEINTPLGVGLTGISQIDHEVKKIERNYEEQTLTEDALLGSISTMKQLTQTINDRLNNAATLVKSFKNISVDQHCEDIREFNLKTYIDDLILSLQSPLKQKKVQISNNIDQNINLESYPGIYSQVLSNFILNSINHGFVDHSGENKITISASMDEALVIEYVDNGIGITDEIEKQLFDPFFTTKRGQGGSGLGLNIVYNLIVQKLSGKVEVKRIEPHGLGFTLRINNP